MRFLWAVLALLAASLPATATARPSTVEVLGQNPITREHDQRCRRDFGHLQPTASGGGARGLDPL